MEFVVRILSYVGGRCRKHGFESPENEIAGGRMWIDGGGLMVGIARITLSSAVDRYVWSLENSGEFSVKSIRQVIDANCFPVIHSATRWVKSVPLKVNIMAWKIKMDGLPTRMNISRRGIEIDSIVCPICNSGAESSCHIFFQCNLVRQLARKISSWWNVDYIDVSSTFSI
ncbi:RNA-directed DNA polymerase, eukaryota [Tanacetum coccineum]